MRPCATHVAGRLVSTSWQRVSSAGGATVCVSSSAAVVDRIAVTVGNQVITETEILREIALTAFLNGEKPSFTPDNKRKAADQLVEQKLVRKEMEMGRYPEATEDQAKELLARR